MSGVEPHGHHVLAESPPPRDATASSHPCELYGYHAPKPVRTQFHHSKPVYLQNRLYGRIVFPADLWVCGSCHDTLHEWIGFLLGESRHPSPEPGRLAKANAQATVDWYRAEQARIAAEQAGR